MEIFFSYYFYRRENFLLILLFAKKIISESITFILISNIRYENILIFITIKIKGIPNKIYLIRSNATDVAVANIPTIDTSIVGEKFLYTRVYIKIVTLLQDTL